VGIRCEIFRENSQLNQQASGCEIFRENSQLNRYGLSQWGLCAVSLLRIPAWFTFRLRATFTVELRQRSELTHH
jgi:hypothetical protein